MLTPLAVAGQLQINSLQIMTLWSGYLKITAVYSCIDLWGSYNCIIKHKPNAFSYALFSGISPFAQFGFADFPGNNRLTKRVINQP